MALKKIQQCGVTMLEVIVVVAITGILALCLQQFFGVFNRSISTASKNLGAQENARSIHVVIASYLCNAKASSITLTQEPNQPPYSEIQFTAISNSTMTIYQSGSDLMLGRPGMTTTVLEGGLQRLVFSYPDLSDPRLIQVTLTTKNTDGKTILGTATQKTYLENP